MGILLCILISGYCFCASTDDSFSDDSPRDLSAETASFSNALYVFENASDYMITRQLTLIDKMLRTHKQIPTSNINVINESKGHCLLRCALEHGMVDLFELACQKRCADMHPEFFHWLIETQSRNLIKQALEAGANPKEKDSAGQDAFDIAANRPHIIELLKGYVAQTT